MVLEVLKLFGRKPRIAGCKVDGADGLVKDVGEEPLTEGVAEAFAWIGRNTLTLVEGLPAEGGELMEKGLFDFGVFGHVWFQTYRVSVILSVTQPAVTTVE